MRPICVACRLFYRPLKNGVDFEHAPPGGPARLWNGDLWECKGCGAQLIVGIAREPIATQDSDFNYNQLKRACPLLLTVEDN